ncbi:MAG: ATP-dependent DNA ligase [Candidatus Altiarchaeales archaeon]|nr:ATP-dependent DNA ligase [Candidatus Altiarchaeales archaeon]
MGEVALTAKRSGGAGLKALSIEPGRPVRVMLSQKTDSVSEILSKFGRMQVETKYDGARIQVHKWEGGLKLFTRRLEDVTKQFPEVVEWSKENVKASSTVIEGEIVALEDGGGRRPRPFQDLSRRIKRKYEIEKVRQEIPVEVNFFDLIYLDGVMKTGESFEARRRLLEESFTPTDSFRLAHSKVTDDERVVEEFYQDSLSLGHEGVMLKVLDAPYKPGSRVGYMYKVKPVLENLDLVVSGATWGEGRRASFLGSYLLSVRDDESGDLLEIGRMATGFSDKQLKRMTDKLKPLITETEGNEVRVKPEVVVEVAYEEIQKSPTYSSGFALRFPRLVRFREDKGVDDADSINRVNKIIESN